MFEEKKANNIFLQSQISTVISKLLSQATVLVDVVTWWRQTSQTNLRKASKETGAIFCEARLRTDNHFHRFEIYSMQPMVHTPKMVLIKWD